MPDLAPAPKVRLEFSEQEARIVRSALRDRIESLAAPIAREQDPIFKEYLRIELKVLNDAVGNITKRVSP